MIVKRNAYVTQSAVWCTTITSSLDLQVLVNSLITLLLRHLTLHAEPPSYISVVSPILLVRMGRTLEEIHWTLEVCAHLIRDIDSSARHQSET